jgi:hypothetical protein
LGSKNAPEEAENEEAEEKHEETATAVEVEKPE